MSPIAFDAAPTFAEAPTLDVIAAPVPAASLPPSTLLFPSRLCSGERYYIVASGLGATTRSVEALLRWASPQAVCVGVGDAAPSNVTRVLFEPDALLRRQQLVHGGEDAESVRVMPIPAGYPWAFWDTWAIFADRPDLLAHPGSFDAYQHFVCRSPYLGGESNVARLTDWNALRAGSLYWHEARSVFDARSGELHQVRNALADDRSRATFDMAIASDPEQLWRHYMSTVFATTDYLTDSAPTTGEHVLNLGVFTGHEIPYFSSLVGPTGVVHNVDPAGHDLLSDYARAWVGSYPHMFREARFAAAATAGTAAFRSYPDGQWCRDLDGSASTRLPLATLDDYVLAANIPAVGFVKIDVEGMEFDALDGMRDTVRRDRPTISLAIYHEADHMWRLPLHLMEQLQGYRFYVSHSSPVRWETVLTAVPNERPRRGLRQSPL